MSEQKARADYIIKATAGNGSLIAYAATTGNTVNESAKIHGTTPVATAALGRLLTAGAIMGSMMKNETDLLTLTAKGDGPLKGILVTANNKVDVKGYVYEPDVDIPLKQNGKLDVSTAIGEGMLSVLKDIGLKDAYVGQVELVSGEIAEDLTYYFAKSEQTPSVVALGVLVDVDYSVKQAGGFILQLLPDCDEEIIAALENKLSDFPAVTDLLEQGKTPEEILEMLVGEFELKINEKQPVSFKCNCTKERVEKALITLGLEELTKILEEDGETTLHCHFCNKDYHFAGAELESLIQNAR